MCLYVYGCVKSNENTSGIVLCYKQADALRAREHETMTMAFVLVNLNISFVSSARLENAIAIAIVPSTWEILAQKKPVLKRKVEWNGGKKWNENFNEKKKKRK